MLTNRSGLSTADDKYNANAIADTVATAVRRGETHFTSMNKQLVVVWFKQYSRTASGNHNVFLLLWVWQESVLGEWCEHNVFYGRRMSG